MINLARAGQIHQGVLPVEALRSILTAPCRHRVSFWHVRINPVRYSHYPVPRPVLFQYLLDADEKKIIKHPVSNLSAWNKRETEGEFQTLYKELIDDETKFYGYIRMSMNTFDVLLKQIESDLRKQDTNFRKCIPPRHRLAVCLRQKNK
ncbi:protein ALP1-like [Aphis craccivora]|uniref:Protein ALP1-like n=1 Tax=Aphis craccivora TaxID=307492 RepID=A0A6G0Y085_APHCR|nr:protein ALP1-like [Aphis craccivora]